MKHYWSLAIEEQFYLLWPVVLLLLARRARRRGVPIVWSVAVAHRGVRRRRAGHRLASSAPDAAYWATPARFGEILVGATLGLPDAFAIRPSRSRHLGPWSGTALAGCLPRVSS